MNSKHTESVLKFKGFLDIRALKSKFILCCINLLTMSVTLDREGKREKKKKFSQLSNQNAKIKYKY